MKQLRSLYNSVVLTCTGAMTEATVTLLGTSHRPPLMTLYGMYVTPNTAACVNPTLTWSHCRCHSHVTAQSDVSLLVLVTSARFTKMSP